MKEKGKKALPLLLALLMLFTVALSACSKSTEKPADSSASPTPSATAEPTATPMEEYTLTMIGRQNDSWPYDKNWPIWKYIKEKTGVSFDVQIPPGEWEEAVNLAVASNNMPDLMYSSSRKVPDSLGAQGAVVNLLDYVDKMPNFKAWMDKYPDKVKSALSTDGKMFLTPNEGNGLGNSMIWMYRKDIFDKNNLQPPTTWDELYSVLKKLKEIYPDSYPLTNRFGVGDVIDGFGPAFGTGDANNWLSYNENSKDFVFGPTDPSYKRITEYLHKFYQDKLMPPDFLTINTKQWQELISTSKGFITFDYIGRIDFFNQAMRTENPEYDMEFMAPPAGPGGKQLLPPLGSVANGLMVSSTSKQIDAVIKYLDWMYSEEGKTTISWGKEGETYKVVGDKKQFIESYPAVADMIKATGFSSDGAWLWYDYDSQVSLMSNELQKAYVEASKYAVPGGVELHFTQDELDSISTVGDPMDTYREENIAKMIIGTSSMDSWESYVAGMNKLGVENILKIHRDAYARFTK